MIGQARRWRSMAAHTAHSHDITLRLTSGLPAGDPCTAWPVALEARASTGRNDFCPILCSKTCPSALAYSSSTKSVATSHAHPPNFPPNPIFLKS